MDKFDELMKQLQEAQQKIDETVVFLKDNMKDVTSEDLHKVKSIIEPYVDEVEKLRNNINKNQITSELLETLIGMTKEDGSKLCDKNGYMIRIMREDDNDYIGTQEFRPNRINLKIDNGLITESYIG